MNPEAPDEDHLTERLEEAHPSSKTGGEPLLRKLLGRKGLLSLGLLALLVIGLYATFTGSSNESPAVSVEEPVSTGPLQLDFNPVPFDLDQILRERLLLEEKTMADPYDVDAHLRLAIARIALGDTISANQLLSNALVTSNDPQTLVTGAMLLARIGKPLKARAALEKVLIDVPEHPEILFHLGIISLHLLHDTDLAIGYWRRAIVATPNRENAAQLGEIVRNLENPPAPAR